MQVPPAIVKVNPHLSAVKDPILSSSFFFHGKSQFLTKILSFFSHFRVCGLDCSPAIVKVNPHLSAVQDLILSSSFFFTENLNV